MPRDKDTTDAASSTTTTSTHSHNRPLINRHNSDISDTHRRPKQYQKQHHAGRLHARVPSSKTLHKHHGHGHAHAHAHINAHHASSSQAGQAQAAQAAAAATKSNTTSTNTVARRQPSPLTPDLMHQLEQAQHTQHKQQTQHAQRSGINLNESQNHHSHRRATSEVKLSRPSSSTDPVDAASSQSSIKRNKSHSEIHRRSKSSDKLKRLSAGHRAKTTVSATKKNHTPKSQVHFALGGQDDGQDEDDDDEWVDASGSNSPHLSRKGSIASTTPQSSLRPADNSRPITPNTTSQLQSPAGPDMLTPDRDSPNYHRDNSAARLLQPTPSHGLPPKMTAEMALANPSNFSPDITSHGSVPSHSSTMVGSTTIIGSGTLVGSSGGGVTSRFVDTPASAGNASDGSFYNRLPVDDGRRLDDNTNTRRLSSAANLSRSHETSHPAISRMINNNDDSALVPRPARRTAGNSAETSRIQQKLNLQRASSAIEPGHVGPRTVGSMETSPLIGVKSPGFDGANARDPRMSKLLERTGMEYLVVRRHQNPVARSLTRIGQIPGLDRPRRIPRLNTGSTSSKRSLDSHMRHQRNVSGGDSRRPTTPRTTTSASIKTLGAGASFEGDDDGQLVGTGDRLSGTSLVGSDPDDGTASLLRNLWDKSMDLSGSID